MKRILSSLACVAIAALVGTGVASAASKHTRHHAPARVAVVAAAQATGSCPLDASLCGPNCPTGPCQSASAVNAAAPAKATFSYNGKACPVSDPSKCTASCPRTSANTAVAAKVSSR